MGWASTSKPGQSGVQQASWSQKLMAPFAATPASAAANNPSAEDVARRQALDPISLGFKSGPETPQLYIAMAEMAHRGGNVAQARQLYQKALTVDPKSMSALLSAARMEDREGNMDVALGLYQNAAAVQPNNPTVLNDLALCLARKGDFAEAHRALVHVVEIEPRKPLYRNNMAKVLIEMNRLDEAAWHLAQVHPPAVVSYNMGVLLHQRGRGQEATQFLAHALQIDPQMQPARTLIAQIATSPTIAAAQPPNQQVVHTAQAPKPTSAATPAEQAAPGIATPAPQISPEATAPPSTGAAATTPAPTLAHLPARLPDVN